MVKVKTTKDSQEELKVKLVEAEAGRIRAIADYQNLEKRIAKEKESLGEFIASALIIEILPVLDNLEAAAKHVNDTGLNLAVDQFKTVLKNIGLEEIKSEGSEFDPNFHEAIEAVEGEEDNKIIEVMNKGYKVMGKVIRPAKVKVSKKQI